MSLRRLGNALTLSLRRLTISRRSRRQYSNSVWVSRIASIRGPASAWECNLFGSCLLEYHMLVDIGLLIVEGGLKYCSTHLGIIYPRGGLRIFG